LPAGFIDEPADISLLLNEGTVQIFKPPSCRRRRSSGGTRALLAARVWLEGRVRRVGPRRRGRTLAAHLQHASLRCRRSKRAIGTFLLGVGITMTMVAARWAG